MEEDRIIRKYPNRRLYDTREGAFINIEGLRQMVLDGEPFRVVDSKSQADLTRATLLQVLSEAEEKGEPLLSEQVLRQMIRFYGSMMQSAFGPYLENAIGHFEVHQQRFTRQMESLFQNGPLGAMQELAQQQSSLMQQWGQMFTGGRTKGPSDSAASQTEADQDSPKK